MNKKSLVLLTTVTSLGLIATTFVATNYKGLLHTFGTEHNSSISLSSSSSVHVSPDDPLVHQVNVRNNKFDVVGYQSSGGSFGSIQKVTLGSEEYRGMVYNRSAINGFKELTVKFSGGPLSYVATDFLMEDMTFASGTSLVSEESVSIPEGKAYFVVYTTDDSKVNIDYVDIDYTCDGSIDSQMIYNKYTSLGGARSIAKSYVKEDSFIEIENNPTKNNNNYSLGAWYKCKDHNHTFVSQTTPTKCAYCESTDIQKLNNSSWYRWCGQYFTDSIDLGTEFTFGMTIMGTYDRMVDSSKYFHYNVWPQFSYGNSSDEQWVQTYIGNDNYEPLGHEGALRPTDPYVSESYSGRFFTDYGYTGSTWAFLDPNTNNIADGSMTFRDAYEAFNMPFWYLKFHVYLNDQNDAWCDITINGMLVYSTYIFDDYDTVNTPSIHIHTMPMHVVNYGVDAEGNPAASYKGWFTYPRLIAPTQTVNVSFECTKDVGSGNALYIAGSFNDWTVDENSRLEWHEGNLWSKSITLPVGETVSFKVVLASYENPTSKTWYPDSNIEWTVPNADCNYTIYW